MPRGDRTGPAGEGPKTGRGLGYCTGYSTPGYTKGKPRGGGGFGRGRGRGFGYRYWAPGPAPGYSPRIQPQSEQPEAGQQVPQDAGISGPAGSEQEAQALKQEAQRLEDQLEEIYDRIDELE